MAGYLGATPVPQATQHRESFTATAAQTTFATAGYTVGFVDVYLNGVHLTPADVTATNGSDVVLGACLVNDIVDIISHSAFELNAQTFTGGVDITGGLTTDGLTADGNILDNAGLKVKGYFTNGGGDGYNVNLGVTGNIGYLQSLNGNSLNPLSLDGSTFSVRTGAFATALTVDATGAVTKPLQPAFLAQPASTQTNIAVNSHVTVVFGTEIFDQNADFASNTFTAPVTGKYQFNTSIRIENWDVSAQYYQLIVQTSNRNYISTWDAALHASADHDFITLNIPCLADMDASDTAIVTLRQNSGAAQADIQSETFFSGFLAC